MYVVVVVVLHIAKVLEAIRRSEKNTRIYTRQRVVGYNRGLGTTRAEEVHLSSGKNGHVSNSTAHSQVSIRLQIAVIFPRSLLTNARLPATARFLSEVLPVYKNTRVVDWEEGRS